MNNLSPSSVIVLGFCIVAGLPIVFILTSFLWQNPPFHRSNFWFAGGIGSIATLLYLGATIALPGNTNLGRVMGTVAFCIVGAVGMTILVFLGSILRDRYAKFFDHAAERYSK